MLLKLLLVISIGKCAIGKSLIFVTDTSVSMRDELHQIKRYVKQYANDFGRDFDTFVSLPFGNTDHLESSTVWDSETFARTINRLTTPEVDTLTVRQECSENSLVAANKAVELSDEGSFIFLFTDAYPRPYDVDKIKSSCKIKKNPVVIFLSGFCFSNGGSSDSDVTLFDDVAASCAGAVIPLHSGDMQQAFVFIKEMIKTKWTDTMHKVSSTGHFNFKVPIASSTSDLVMAVSGDIMSIDVSHEGKSLSPLEKIVDTIYKQLNGNTLQTATSQVLRVKDLHAGTINIDIKARSQVALTMFSKKEFPFNYGFSSRSPRSLKETSKRPFPGRDNKLFIVIPEDFNGELNNYIQIQTNDNVNTLLSITNIPNKPKAYISDDFKVDKSYKLIVSGSLDSQEKFAESTSWIEPQSYSGTKPEAFRPVVETLEDEMLLVESGANVVLACKITGYPEPSMTWRRDDHVEYPAEVVFLEIPSVYISYVTIGDVTTNNTYYCTAKNKQGFSESSAQILVKKDYFIEKFQVPNDQSVRYGKSITLPCTVKSKPKANIKWFFNQTSILFNDRVEISEIDNSLSIKSMDVDDIGTYTCEADNVYEKMQFSAFVSLTGLEAPKIDSFFKKTVFVWNIGSNEELECRVTKGIPPPKLRWLHKTSEEYKPVNDKVYAVDEKLRFGDVKEHHAGNYKCVAENIEGEDSMEFLVQIRLPPKILNAKEDHISVKEGKDVEMPCRVEGDNTETRWEIVTDTRSKPLDERKTVDSDHTLRFTALQRDSGSYRCFARNDVGTDERVVHLNVMVRPYIKAPESQTVTVREGSRVTLPCQVLHGNPSPTTTWEYVSETDGPSITLPGGTSGDLVLNASADLAGIYSCLATNSIGRDIIKIRLIVH